MCGILAVVHFDEQPPDEGLVVRMRDAMYHRGPDDAGLYTAGPVALGHRRLAIIDLSPSARQPLGNEDGSLQLVFNGEIYNYVEQTKDLKARSHRFTSSSDGEVILHQYEERGERCLHVLNGIFAFALWDWRTRRLFAARDRIGVKPLYMFMDGRRLILASEIKAILEDPSVPREPDCEAIADYMFAGRALGGRTLFRHIRELEPGHLLSVDVRSRRVRVEKFWDLTYDYNYSRTLPRLRDEVAQLLDDAVRIQCRSDAALGCHLSGGLDSSTVVGLAARHRSALPVFSIKFSDDPAIDETPYAKAVARHVGASYVEGSPTSLDLERLLPFLIWQMDGPMATNGGFSYFAVSALAQGHVKVTLTGHGGDEVFAGYPAQFQAAFGRADMFEEQARPPGRPLWSILSSMRERLLRGTLSSLESRWMQLHCGGLPALTEACLHALSVARRRMVPEGAARLREGYRQMCEETHDLYRSLVQKERGSFLSENELSHCDVAT